MSVLSFDRSAMPVILNQSSIDNPNPQSAIRNPQFTDNSRMHLPHVVIIGGGFGGLWAAKALKHAPVRVTLLDRHNHHVFQPLLYQVATAALSPGDIASPIRWILRRQRNTRVLLAEARHIDTAMKRVDLDHGESLSYDYLILAAGSSSSYFGHDGWQESAPSLKTLDDALPIRGRMLVPYELARR